MVPNYTFELKDGTSGIEDNGIEFPDREAAIAYAHQVARELMLHRELKTRFWRLDIREEGSPQVSEVLFASIDQTLNHLGPELRALIQRLCDQWRSLAEAGHCAQATIRQSRALVARSRGKPFLATDRGKLIGL